MGASAVLTAASCCGLHVRYCPRVQVWDGSQQHCGQFGDLMACMEAARERQLPPAYERDLVMLHTMKPHFDAVKQGGLVVVCV